MRRSGLRLIGALVCALIVAAAVYWTTSSITAPTAPRPMPTATALPPQVPLPTPTDLPSSTPTPSSKPTSSQKPVVIKASEPTLLYFPSLKKYVVMDDKSCPRDADGLFDPDRTKMMAACYVHDNDHVYVLPGTQTVDVSVMYGHTWRQGQAAFNVLFDWKKQQFTLKKGDKVWVRTRASGKRWLVYEATDFFKPNKYGEKSLRTDTKIWGAAPMPNTLITAGCLQPQDLDLHSSRNIVIRWKFVGVKK